MMPAIRSYIQTNRESITRLRNLKMRAHLNADALFATLRKDFDKVHEDRASNIKIHLVDALMRGFAMFQFLHAFDERRCAEPKSRHVLFGVGG